MPSIVSRLDSPASFCSPEKLLKIAKKGDLIEFERGKFKHWAVFVGHVFVYVGPAGLTETVPCVVHFSNGTIGDSNSKDSFNVSSSGNSKTCIRIQSFEEVANNCPCRINNALDSIMGAPFTGEQVMERAFSKTGKSDYSLLFNNCEHFCNWCRYDEGKSLQSQQAIIPLSIVTMVGAIGLGAIAVYKGKLSSSSDEEKSKVHRYE